MVRKVIREKKKTASDLKYFRPVSEQRKTMRKIKQILNSGDIFLCFYAQKKFTHYNF